MKETEGSIRQIGCEMRDKYKNLSAAHVMWIAKQLNIYPNGIVSKKKNTVGKSHMGKINTQSEFVALMGDGINNMSNSWRITPEGKQAIENWIIEEGYIPKQNITEELKDKPEMKTNANDMYQNFLEMAEKAEKYEQLREKCDDLIREKSDLLIKIDTLTDEISQYKKANSQLINEKQELVRNTNAKVYDDLTQQIAKFKDEFSKIQAEYFEVEKYLKDVKVKANKTENDIRDFANKWIEFQKTSRNLLKTLA